MDETRETVRFVWPDLDPFANSGIVSPAIAHGPWVVLFDMVWREDRWRCEGVHITPAWDLAGDDPWLTGEVLKKIPFGRLLQRARAGVRPLRVIQRAMTAAGQEASGVPLDEIEWIRLAKSGMPDRRGGEKALSHRVLEETADVYKAALKHGNPTKAVAEHFDLSYSGAQKRVRAVRKVRPDLLPDPPNEGFPAAKRRGNAEIATKGEAEEQLRRAAESRRRQRAS